jgi:hypothetical protein
VSVRADHLSRNFTQNRSRNTERTRVGPKSRYAPPPPKHRAASHQQSFVNTRQTASSPVPGHVLAGDLHMRHFYFVKNAYTLNPFYEWRLKLTVAALQIHCSDPELRPQRSASASQRVKGPKHEARCPTDDEMQNPWTFRSSWLGAGTEKWHDESVTFERHRKLVSK